ncbi:MAG: hypothetical protein RBT69_08545 [Spirochaetia bacterium]|jgi:hypothetical protein|nr:hypothetical protein [Spirochaetia bacterium]
MFGVNSYLYLIDSLNSTNGKVLKTALETVPGVKSVAISPVKGLIEVKAKADVTESVKIACTVAGVKLRTRVNSGSI